MSSRRESVAQEETPPACRRSAGLQTGIARASGRNEREAAPPRMTTEAIRAAHRDYVLPAVQTFYDEPMPIVRGGDSTSGTRTGTGIWTSSAGSSPSASATATRR